MGGERKRTQPSQVQQAQPQQVPRPVQNGQYRQAQPPRPPMSNGYAMTQQATLAAAAGMMQRPRTAPHRAQPRYTANVMMSNQVSVPNMTSVPMSVSSITMTGMMPAAPRTVVSPVAPKMRNTPSASMTPPRPGKKYESHTPYRKNDDEPVGYYE